MIIVRNIEGRNLADFDSIEEAREALMIDGYEPEALPPNAVYVGSAPLEAFRRTGWDTPSDYVQLFEESYYA